MATKEIQQPPAPRSRNPLPSGNAFKKPWDDMVKFLRGVRYEINKVTWPTRQELQYNAAVVILITVFITAYMWGVDKILGYLFQWLHRG